MSPPELPLDCDAVLDRLEAYLDALAEDGAAEDRAAIAAHLASCRDCADELALARQVRNGLRALAPQEAPARVLDSVLAAVREEAGGESAGPSEGEPPAPRWRTWWSAGLAAAAAALLLVVGVVYLNSRVDRGASEATGTVASAGVEISPEELAEVEAEVRWALAYVGEISRRSALTVRDRALADNVVRPTREAMSRAVAAAWPELDRQGAEAEP